MKAESLFASKAVVGMRYLTKNGYPVLVLERKGEDVIVKNELNGHRVTVFASQLLYPYRKDGISKEATTMAKATKTAAKEQVRESSLEYVKGKRKLEREYKGKKYEIAVLSDGFKWGAQTFPSLSAVAMAITKRPEVDGPRWFGLRKAA